ncbi:MAG TPA: glycosyltransferase, partial [Anaerolineaceae bacterium]
MRILLAVHGFPPLQNLGAERAAQRIADWLVEHGHHVEVFTTGEIHHKAPFLQTVQQNGMLVHRLSYEVRDGNEFLNMYNNPVIAAALKPILEEGHFDLLHLISGY